MLFSVVVNDGLCVINCRQHDIFELDWSNGQATVTVVECTHWHMKLPYSDIFMIDLF